MSARSVLATLAAAVAVALPAGCARAGSTTPIARETVADLPVLTTVQTRGLASVSWELVGSAGPGDRLSVRVPGALCPRLRGVAVTETPTQVNLRVFATITRCSKAEGAYVAAPVRLPTPLGDRRLGHGPVTPPLPGIVNGPPARD